MPVFMLIYNFSRWKKLLSVNYNTIDFRALEQELYHYFDCSGRMVRDCLVTSHATQLLRNIAARASP